MTTSANAMNAFQFSSPMHLHIVNIRGFVNGKFGSQMRAVFMWLLQICLNARSSYLDRDHGRASCHSWTRKGFSCIDHIKDDVCFALVVFFIYCLNVHIFDKRWHGIPVFSDGFGRTILMWVDLGASPTDIFLGGLEDRTIYYSFVVLLPYKPAYIFLKASIRDILPPLSVYNGRGHGYRWTEHCSCAGKSDGNWADTAKQRER